MKHACKVLPERVCRYEGCGKKFKPKRLWQFYCTERCHDQAWAAKRRDTTTPDVSNTPAHSELIESLRMARKSNIRGE